MIKQINSRPNIDHRSEFAKQQETLPTLENFINCCNYNKVDNLQKILDNELEYFKSNPQKIVDGYLNYCATGHDEVLNVLLNFSKNHNIDTQDKNYECFEYLYYKKRFARMDTLLENGVWEFSGLINYMKNRSQSIPSTQDKNTMLQMATELEKAMLEQELKQSPQLPHTKPKFKL